MRVEDPIIGRQQGLTTKLTFQRADRIVTGIHFTSNRGGPLWQFCLTKKPDEACQRLATSQSVSKRHTHFCQQHHSDVELSEQVPFQ